MAADDRPKFGRFTPEGLKSKEQLAAAPPVAPGPGPSAPARPPLPPTAPPAPSAPTAAVPVVPVVRAAPAPTPPPMAMAVPVPSPTAAAPVPPVAYGFRRTGKTRNPWGVWFFVVITLGFYGAYWYYKVNEEVRDYDPSIRVNPAGALCALWFGWALCFIPTIVSWVNTASRIAKAQTTAGRREQCSGGILLLASLLPGGGYVYAQHHLNLVWAAHGSPPAGTPV